MVPNHTTGRSDKVLRTAPGTCSDSTNATPHLIGRYTHLGAVEDPEQALPLLDALELNARIVKVEVLPEGKPAPAPKASPAVKAVKPPKTVKPPKKAKATKAPRKPTKGRHRKG